MRLHKQISKGLRQTQRRSSRPQTPQLGGGGQANFGDPKSEIAFWLRDYFQFSRLVYNRFKL